MATRTHHLSQTLSSIQSDLMEAVLTDFESDLKRGLSCNFDDYLARAPESRASLLMELLHIDLEFRLKQGESIRVDQYLTRYPELWAEPDRVADLIFAEYRVRRVKEPGLNLEAYVARFPELADKLHARFVPEACEVVDSAPSAAMQIGRYRVERMLGEGGFGQVFLAVDETLGRRVAIKIPRREFMSHPRDAAAFLAEARTLASLSHPHIVAVHDVGVTPDGVCFVVSQLIDGRDLAHVLRESRFTPASAAELTATVAEALHHAHCKGLVHRDIKPANILIDSAGKPYVADFGLALAIADFDKEPILAGTPAYMSPEQARGEGHRVDGRSDIFSLGAVLYEMLANRQPFHAETRAKLLVQIATLEVRPPRQWNDALPHELERICLKALARRVSDRYTTAKDFAADLRQFLQSSSEPRNRSFPAAFSSNPREPAFGDSRSILQIIPKGLRSFDAQDADFFLKLLPGPCDREGLPESIRFWKTRLEETDPDRTFCVGLIYGPSGCGKSSLVKAGLLPRLSDHLIVVYLEATAEETESRLRKGLCKQCPELETQTSLKNMLSALRKGQGSPRGKKVVILLDQFEQWLHAKRGQQDSELVQALRQCDGGRVQCVVMVRDDFWLSATRFLRELEIKLVEGHNSALADLFDIDHAKKVLAAFGRAYEKLPDLEDDGKKQHEEFLTQAIQGLAEDGKVICVRLALFAEMMKGKPWTTRALKEIGGAAGVGVSFLDGTFSASTAPPEHRYHQEAARAVLKALLPSPGTDIKGHMRSSAELMAASGYAKRPHDFDDLIRILDSEIRLVTPTDPQGLVDESGLRTTTSVKTTSPAECSDEPTVSYYQLTHDYLVPSLRDWLTRKQKETVRGRAELLLADRSQAWNARPEIRELPSLLQWAKIRLLTSRRNWTPAQGKMMRRAGKRYAFRGLLYFACLVLIGAIAWDMYGHFNAKVLCDRIQEAKTEQVQGIVREMAPYRSWVNPMLKRAAKQMPEGEQSLKRLHLSLALAPVDPAHVEILYDHLLNRAAEANEAVAIRRALRDQKGHDPERLWGVLENAKNDPDRRFRAACALAELDPVNPRWQKNAEHVAEMLVIQEPFVVAQWTEAFRPVGKLLIPSLANFIEEDKRSGAEAGLIATVFGKFAADLPEAYLRLEQRLTTAAQPTITPKQLANIAASLMLIGRTEMIWPLLKHSPDPTLRSFLIERFGPMGVAPKLLIAQLEQEKDASIRTAILLSLGEFGLNRLSGSDRRALLPRLQRTYLEDPDPGVHGAVERLLRLWRADDVLAEMDRTLASEGLTKNRRWYVSPQGQTMTRVQPGEIWIGEDDERRLLRVEGAFAIASKEVAIAQFVAVMKRPPQGNNDAPNCPITSITWHDAAEYCNLLSKLEKIPEEQWCYLPVYNGAVKIGMKTAPGFLERTGYRLPTEAEWELACRAGSTTEFSFGAAEELADKYAWHFGNSPTRCRAVGSLKPNDLGLFDTHGNALELCHHTPALDAKPEAKEPSEETPKPMGDVLVLRGGSFYDRVGDVRSTERIGTVPVIRDFDVGFRIARTIRP